MKSETAPQPLEAGASQNFMEVYALELGLRETEISAIQ